MVSPAMTAVATGRKIGRINASAAAGNRVPFVRTSVSNAGPCPGRGPTPVVRRKMPTTTGSPASSAIVSHVRGRRTSLPNSTASIAASSCQSEIGVLEAAAFHHQFAHPYTGVHEGMVEGLGWLAIELDAHPAVGVVDVAAVAGQQCHRGGGVGGVDEQPA